MSLNYEGRTEEMKPLKPSLRKDGYLQISLSKNKKTKKYLVHRLVAENFIENKNNLHIVNHKNGFKIDNNISNLEWTTSSENTIHAYNTGLKKKYIGKENWNSKKVKQLDLQGNLIKVFNSINEAKKETNTHHISECCLGKRKSANGYIWEYGG